jgi:hypothetical protein
MNRTQREHILRAAAAITGTDEFVVVGSQAVLGQFPHPPQELLASMEADVFSLRSPNDAELIDGSIGEASPFHRAFGYFAHGVGEETAILPSGWRSRLVPLTSPATGGATGWCLEVHDLAVSKLAAGRPKDVEYVRVLLAHRLVSADTLRARLSQTPLSAEIASAAADRLNRLAKDHN